MTARSHPQETSLQGFTVDIASTKTHSWPSGVSIFPETSLTAVIPAQAAVENHPKKVSGYGLLIADQTIWTSEVGSE